MITQLLIRMASKIAGPHRIPIAGDDGKIAAGFIPSGLTGKGDVKALIEQFTGTYGDYGTRSAGGTANTRFSFIVPDDFGSLDSACLIVIPTSTGAGKNIDLYSSYAKDGEDYQTHQESDLIFTYNFTAGQITKIDLTGIISNISAGDRVGIYSDHKSIGLTLHYIGTEIIYTRI